MSSSQIILMVYVNTGDPTMEAKTKKAVIATLLSVKRPDLANVAAKIPVRTRKPVKAASVLDYTKDTVSAIKKQVTMAIKVVGNDPIKAAFLILLAMRNANANEEADLIEPLLKKNLKITKSIQMMVPPTARQKIKSKLSFAVPSAFTINQIESFAVLLLRAIDRPDLATLIDRKLYKEIKDEGLDETWEQKAKAELEKVIDAEMEVERTDESNHMIELSGGGTEYMVFENYDMAESFTVERVKSDLDDDPSMFNQDWLEGHMYVSDTDRRIIAQEEADSYVYDLDDERVIEEADMKDEWDELEERESAEEDPEALKKIEKEKEALVDSAKETLSSKMSDDIEKRLKDDLRGYLDDLGMSVKDATFVRIDSEEAAKDAVNTDGVEHFLASYDGNVTELPSGAVAYRTN